MPAFARHDPAKDRVAGALLGLGVAADQVGAPPPLARSGPTRHVSDLVLTALHDLDTGPDPAAEPPHHTESSWARTLRHLARTATLPDSVPDLEHAPRTTRAAPPGKPYAICPEPATPTSYSPRH